MLMKCCTVTEGGFQIQGCAQQNVPLLRGTFRLQRVFSGLELPLDSASAECDTKKHSFPQISQQGRRRSLCSRQSSVVCHP